jgi:hypothetical protein
MGQRLRDLVCYCRNVWCRILSGAMSQAMRGHPHLTFFRSNLSSTPWNRVFLARPTLRLTLISLIWSGFGAVESSPYPL